MVLFVPWTGREEAAPDPSILSGKIVIGTINRYGPDGTLDLGGATAASLNARWLDGVFLRKASNTLTLQFQVDLGGVETGAALDPQSSIWNVVMTPEELCERLGLRAEAPSS